MASIQVRHQRACAIGRPWTTPDDAREGCTCRPQPTYYVVVRQGRKAHRHRVGHNLREAERALRRIGVQEDDGTYRAPKRIRFVDFATEWLERLERKPTTVASYQSTMKYAIEAFGHKDVGRIGTADVGALVVQLRDRGLSASTRAKHLRVLRSCFDAARAEGYTGRNPVADLPKAHRPRPKKRESAFFTNDEVPVLLEHLPEGVARPLVEAALKTGCRLGELLGLEWGDVELASGIAHIRRTRTQGHVHAPKTHEKREVVLVDDLVEVLGRWYGELGLPADEALVFPGGARDGYLDPTTVTSRLLYGAMAAAGIPRVGPTGEKRTFHSLRHTFAKRVLESGASITWLSRQLGHSSITVTVDVYGHFESAERLREAKKLEGMWTFTARTQTEGPPAPSCGMRNGSSRHCDVAHSAGRGRQ